MADWSPRANDLFLRAAEIESAGKRRDFLDTECAGDASLREQVESLLAAGDKLGDFLNQPAARVSETVAPTDDYRPVTEGPGSVIGPYKLLQKIGEGGFGVVYMAEQQRPLRRTVALKIIKPGMDTAQVIARFESERQARAMMDQPNIAKVLDAGATESGRPYFVMELVKGVPITEFCDRNHMPAEQRLRLFIDVCHAIQHAHHKGVIHRDIKPSNVMVTLHDGVPVVKVIDFGIAKATAQKLTERTLFTAYGQMIGTPAYMSPEQAEMSGLDIDTRSDIYSLGVLVYELLTGTTPLESRQLREAGYAEMQRLIREEEPPRPSARLSSLGDSATVLAGNRGTDVRRLARLLSGDLDWIVMKALDKDRNGRYSTPGSFAEDIDRYLRHDAIQARSPSALYKLRKYVRRHRAIVLMVMAVATALILGTAIATWQAVVATQARNEATRQRDAATAARNAEAGARQQAVAARSQAVLALATSERLTARLTYERGQALCEQGQIDLGMLWLARALELTPTDAADLERAIRVSLNGWAMQLNTVEAVFPFTWGVSSLAPSPDGRTIITSHREGIVRFWDAFTGVPKDPPMAAPGKTDGLAASVNQAVFSRDGRLIATASDDRTARVWEAASRQPLGPSMLHDDPVVDISFDPQAKVVATAAGKQIHFWNVATGQREERRLETPEDVTGVAYSPDGRRLAAWAGETAWLWDAATRQPVGMPMMHSQRIWTAAFSPDSARLLTNEENATRFWDADTGQPAGPAYSWKNRQGSEVYGRVSFRADGMLVATAGYPPRLWDVTTGKNVSAANSLLEAHHVALSVDGRHLVIARREGSFVRLDLAPGLAPLHSFPIGEGTYLMIPGADDRTCVTVGQDRDGRACRLWNIQTGRQVGSRIAQEQDSEYYCPRPVFSPDGRTLAARSGKSGCQLWDTSTGRRLGPVLEHHKVVRGMAISPDSRMLATGDVEGTIRFWDVTTGRPLGPPLKHNLSVQWLRFSPDGRNLLAAGGRLGSIRGEARL
jgi:serine/threonine protein kinase/WD40 repeat protein